MFRLHHSNGISVLTRTLLFSLLWWLLTNGNLQSWWVGVPAVGLTVVASISLLPPASIVWLELFKTIPFFVWLSLQGGIDVAWRAFHPQMPIAPAIINYPLRLSSGLAQVVLANMVSLLPGTLSVHVLDSGGDVMVELKALEDRVARMFGELLTAPT